MKLNPYGQRNKCIETLKKNFDIQEYTYVNVYYNV